MTDSPVIELKISRWTPTRRRDSAHSRKTA